MANIGVPQRTIEVVPLNEPVPAPQEVPSEPLIQPEEVPANE
jgi:hypothetical protein